MRTRIVAVLLALMLTPTRARADSEADTALSAAVEHYRLGQAAFEAGHFEEAIRELRRAHALSHRPALLLNIARTYQKLMQPRAAADYYQKYLDAAPDAADREEIERAIAAALKSDAGAGSGTAPASLPAARVEPPKSQFSNDPCVAPIEALKGEFPAAALEWAHEPIDSATEGVAVDVEVQAPVAREVKVFLNYRAQGEADFKAVEMRRHGTEKIGQIPASAVRGRSIQYYLEARHLPTGTIVYTAGTQIDPNVIIVE